MNEKGMERERSSKRARVILEKKEREIKAASTCVSFSLCVSLCVNSQYFLQFCLPKKIRSLSLSLAFHLASILTGKQICSSLMLMPVHHLFILCVFIQFNRTLYERIKSIHSIQNRVFYISVFFFFSILLFVGQCKSIREKRVR